METVTKRDFNKLMQKVSAIEIATNQAALVNDLIDEPTAAKLLNRSVKTMQNRVANGSISREAYTIGDGGNRFYKKSYLLGVKTA